jgi:hypothetical protein
MNIIKEFIQNENIENIEVFREKIENEPYFLKLKKFKNNNLMIIIHQDNTNMENELCKHAHGVIIDNELNIIRYTGKKAYEHENNDFSIYDDIQNENALLTPIIDGTFMSVFKYDNKIYYSTKKAIEARLSRWHCNKNFEDLFKEAINDENFESMIQDGYCYNFILCSKENSNIITYDNSSVILLNVIQFNHKDNVNICFFENLLNNLNIKYIENMKIENMSEFIETYDKDKLEYLGIYVTDFVNSQKIYFNNYMKLKNILPNNHDILYTFLTLRKNTYMLNLYLENNNNKKNTFKDFESNIVNFVCYIHKLYLTMRIQKKKIEIPAFIRTTLYKIHGIYLTTKNPITLNVIFNHLNILHEKQLYVLLKKYNTFINNENNNSMDIDNINNENSVEDELAELESYNVE